MVVKFGQSLPTAGANATPENIRAAAQRAEDLGFDSIWVSDHLVIPHSIGSNYPYTHDGATPFSPRGTYFDSISKVADQCTPRQRRLLGDLGYEFRPGSYFYAPLDQEKIIYGSAA